MKTVQKMINLPEFFAEAVADLSVGYQKNAELIEKTAIKECDNYYKSLLDQLKEAGPIVPYESLKEKIKSDKAKTRKRIRGAVKRTLKKRLSVKDAECQATFNAAMYSEKEAALRQFAKKILKDAVKDLAMDVRQLMKEQRESLVYDLTDLQKQKKEEVKALKKQCSRRKKEDQNEIRDLEQKCYEAAMILEGIGVAETLLKAGEKNSEQMEDAGIGKTPGTGSDIPGNESGKRQAKRRDSAKAPGNQAGRKKADRKSKQRPEKSD